MITGYGYEITPEMIEAGVTALRSEIGSSPEVRSRSPEFDPVTVRAVIEAALATIPFQVRGLAGTLPPRDPDACPLPHETLAGR